MSKQLHLSSEETLSLLEANGFTIEQLQTEVSARKEARQLINEHCGTKWTSGTLIPGDQTHKDLWVLYTANKGLSKEIKL